MTESQQYPVPVAVAPNEIAAHMLRHVLEAQDIECFVFGDNAKIVLFWSALTQVRVEVRRCDYERAREALEAFAERVNASLPEQRMRGHCVVCGYDRDGLNAHAVCPGCGSQPRVWKINEGQFQIVSSPTEASSACASFVGYAVLVLIAVLLVIGTANLMGYI